MRMVQAKMPVPTSPLQSGFGSVLAGAVDRAPRPGERVGSDVGDAARRGRQVRGAFAPAGEIGHGGEIIPPRHPERPDRRGKALSESGGAKFDHGSGGIIPLRAA